MDAQIEQIPKIKKDSLIKRILLAGGETANAMKLSYILGAVSGATGRLTGAEWIPAIPPVMDLFYGIAPTPERFACYVAYGVGIATSYADKIYSTMTN